MRKLIDFGGPVDVLLGPSMWRFKLYRRGWRIMLMVAMFGRFDERGQVCMVKGRIGLPWPS